MGRFSGSHRHESLLSETTCNLAAGAGRLGGGKFRCAGTASELRRQTGRLHHNDHSSPVSRLPPGDRNKIAGRRASAPRAVDDVPTSSAAPSRPIRTGSQRAFPHHKFHNPVYLTPEPGTDRLFVVEYSEAVVRAIRDDPNSKEEVEILQFPAGKGKKAEALLARLPSELSSRTGCSTFLPTSATSNEPRDEHNQIVRFRVGTTPPYAILPESREVIIEWASAGHDGGDMGFGPDGCLYITAGDGTTGSDPDITGQDLTDLRASMLRIDVDHPANGKPYGIPKDNPFLHIPKARPEIWAFGLRNPWRMSFDPATGNLWVGDVGQDLWEMIHLVRRGGNYGWSVMEGTHPFYPGSQDRPGPHLAADRGTSSLGGPLDHRGLRLSRQTAARAGQPLPLLLLPDGDGLGLPLRKRPRARPSRAGPFDLPLRKLGPRPRGRAVSGRPFGRDFPARAQPGGQGWGGAVSQTAERDGAVRLGRRRASRAGRDSLFGQRSRLARRGRPVAVPGVPNDDTINPEHVPRLGLHGRGRAGADPVAGDGAGQSRQPQEDRNAPADPPGGRMVRLFLRLERRRRPTRASCAKRARNASCASATPRRPAERGSRPGTFSAGPSAWSAIRGRPTSCSASRRCR